MTKKTSNIYLEEPIGISCESPTNFKTKQGLIAFSGRNWEVSRRLIINIPKALELVWASHPLYCASLVIILLLQGFQPLLGAWLMKEVLDRITLVLTQDGLLMPGIGRVSGGTRDASGVIHGSGSIVQQVSLLSDAGLNSVILSIFGLLLLTGLVNLLGQLLTSTAQFIQTELGEHLSYRVNSLILEKTNSFSDLTLFENPRFYDSLQRAQSEATFRPLSMLQGLVLVLRNGISLVGIVAILTAFQPLLVLLSGMLSLPALLIQFRNQHHNWAIRSRQVSEVRQMQYFSSLLTSKEPAKEIRVFGLGQHFLKRYQSLFEKFRARLGRVRLVQWRWNTLLGILASLSGIISYSYIVLQTLLGRLSLGSLTFYNTLFGQFHNTLSVIISQAASVYEGSLFAGHLFEFLSLVPAMPAGKGCLPPIPLKRGIVFRDVKFSYSHFAKNGSSGPANNGCENEGETLILKGINFTIEAGQTVALVGENGAGKSTLVKLLTRLCDPTEGVIEVDGLDLREYDREEWRCQLAVVFQDFCRYHLTVRENIGLGKVSQLENLELVRAAAERGGAAPVIARLPRGFETNLGRWLSGANGEEGSELSGGEWQKIALSRAFMRLDGPTHANERVSQLMSLACDGAITYQQNGERTRTDKEAQAHPVLHSCEDAISYPPAQILVLDEPSAALDAQSENALFEGFHNLSRGKTTILISHRLSNVRMADKIILLKEGQVLEEGSHAELMALEGEYARLYSLQAEAYQHL